MTPIVLEKEIEAEILGKLLQVTQLKSASK